MVADAAALRQGCNEGMLSLLLTSLKTYTS